MAYRLTSWVHTPQEEKEVVGYPTKDAALDAAKAWARKKNMHLQGSSQERETKIMGVVSDKTDRWVGAVTFTKIEDLEYLSSLSATAKKNPAWRLDFFKADRRSGKLSKTPHSSAYYPSMDAAKNVVERSINAERGTSTPWYRVKDCYRRTWERQGEFTLCEVNDLEYLASLGKKAKKNPGFKLYAKKRDSLDWEFIQYFDDHDTAKQHGKKLPFPYAFYSVRRLDDLEYLARQAAKKNGSFFRLEYVDRGKGARHRSFRKSDVFETEEEAMDRAYALANRNLTSWSNLFWTDTGLYYLTAYSRERVFRIVPAEDLEYLASLTTKDNPKREKRRV